MHGSQTEFHWMQDFTYGEGLLCTHPLVSIEDAEHANQAASPQAQFWVESHRIICSMKQRYDWPSLPLKTVSACLSIAEGHARAFLHIWYWEYCILCLLNKLGSSSLPARAC